MDYKEQVGQYIKDHTSRYEEGTAWITKRKAINTRTLLDVIRENYFGIFKDEKDRFGQQKIFYPLTEFMTAETVKNIDIDTKDINVVSKNGKNLGITAVYRQLCKDWMDRENFGETLNEWLTHFALDGHLIVKTIITKDRKGKKRLVVKRVDPRNLFIDPNAESIHDTAVVERSVVDADWLKRTYSGVYKDLDKIKGRFDIPELYDENKEAKSTNPQVEIYEFWGQLPKHYVYGGKESEEYVEAHAVVADNGNEYDVLFIEEFKDIRPYEEVRFEDAPARWLGRGVGEKILYLQLYLNILFNTRRVNSFLSANQLWQVRKGSGITAAGLRDLMTGGVLEVEQIGDIARVDTQNLDFGQSMNEEQNIVNVAQRNTSTYEAATGEALPSSTPATNAVLQAQQVKSSFALRQERFGIFLKELFRNQLVPRFTKIYKKNDVIRIMDDVDKIRTLKQDYIELLVNEKMVEFMEKGIYPSPEQELITREEISSQVFKMKGLYTQLEDLFADPDELDIKFNITNEGFDKQTILQNLQYILGNFQALQDPNAQRIFRRMFDILGIDSEDVLPEQAQVNPNIAQQASSMPNAGQEQNAKVPQRPNPQQILNNTQETAIQ